MNYLKKMCILRQIRQGFSGDGKTVSGLVKIEQYGKNLAIEVSVVGFAPLVSGEYYCLISDGKGKTEMLSLRGKSLFNILSDLDISEGFCSVVCFVKDEVVPVAYGVNGKGVYDWRAILNATLPPVFPSVNDEPPLPKATPVAVTTDEVMLKKYDDESLAENNYYEEKTALEYQQPDENPQNASPQSGIPQEREGNGATASADVDAPSVRPTLPKGDGYYLSVKQELSELFAKYPHDDTMRSAFASSEWVRLRGEEGAPEYLVGVLYADGKAEYVCYALAAKDGRTPPEEIEGVCSFVPTSTFEHAEGFFVLFQSAASGVCVRPNFS